MVLSAWANRLRDLRGNLLRWRDTTPPPAPTAEEDAEAAAEALEFRITQAARLAARTKRMPGVGWFPGDPL